MSSSQMARSKTSCDLSHTHLPGLTLPCTYCSGVADRDGPAEKFPDDHIGKLVEHHAVHKCWKFMIEPLMSYLSCQHYMSPELVRYLLHSLDSLDEKDFRAVKILLDVHCELHPPCRAKMYEYYSYVFLDPVTSRVFTGDMLRQNLFDLIRKIECTFRENQQNLSPAKTPLKNHELQHSKQVSAEKSLIFAFSYYLKILLHDFKHKLNNEKSKNLPPLVQKFVWGNMADEISINLHCQDVFRIYSKVEPQCRVYFGTYLVLLAEVVRLNSVNADPEFPHWSGSCYVFVKRLCQSLKVDGEITDVTLNLIAEIPSNWLRYQISVKMLTEQLIGSACYPNVKGRKKKKNSKCKLKK